jgi:hypothetical protein
MLRPIMMSSSVRQTAAGEPLAMRGTLRRIRESQQPSSANGGKALGELSLLAVRWMT